MAVKVIIPTPLRAYTGKRDSAEFNAATVGEALGHLTTQFGANTCSLKTASSAASSTSTSTTKISAISRKKILRPRMATPSASSPPSPAVVPWSAVVDHVSLIVTPLLIVIFRAAATKKSLPSCG